MRIDQDQGIHFQRESVITRHRSGEITSNPYVGFRSTTSRRWSDACQRFRVIDGGGAGVRTTQLGKISLVELYERLQYKRTAAGILAKGNRPDPYAALTLHGSRCRVRTLPRHCARGRLFNRRGFAPMSRPS